MSHTRKNQDNTPLLPDSTPSYPNNTAASEAGVLPTQNPAPQVASETRHANQYHLDNSRAHYFDLYDLAPIGYCTINLDGQMLQMNVAISILLGLPRRVLSKKSIAHFIRPEDQNIFYHYCNQLLKNNPPKSCELQMLKPDKQAFWVHITSTVHQSERGLKEIRMAVHDISERKKIEEKLYLAASVFTYAHEGIMITTADGKIIDINNAFSRLTGYSREEIIGKNPRILKSGQHDANFYAGIWQKLLFEGYWQGEIWNKRKNGELYVALQTISAVRDTQGKVRQYISLFSDITLRKEQQQQLEHLAHYDPLTKLPNRVLLADRLQQAMTQAQRRGQQIALVYLDLDGFKNINDKHGHDAGDKLLIALADNMKASLREGDTLTRLGGDEFVAVLIDLPDAAAGVPIIQRLLSAAAQTVQIDHKILQVSASLGITFYPQIEETDADQLLRQADQAMYQAKQAGKNRYHVFDTELDRSVRGHHENIERIRHALHAKEFVLYYQPKVNMRTGAVIGAEALIRWQHSEQGLLLPASFLPIIEDHALAIEVGEWVINTALNEMEQWHKAGLDIHISVNIGARQLQQSNFVTRLGKILAAHPHIKPHYLELEVLETSALKDMNHISEVIEACRLLGVTFSLDDFGTGYSSLTYLKRLPVTQLKIDQSFVRDMLDDPADLSILDAVLGLASAFRRQVIAEGVETVAHGKMLLQLGCELAQGYGIARPMPASQLLDWAANWHPDPDWDNRASINREDLPLLFARAEHRALIKAIEHYIKDECKILPLSYQECRFGAWLQTAGLVKYGAQPIFQSITDNHREVHLLAESLIDLHTQGAASDAVARLDELYELRDELTEQLQVLAQEKRPTLKKPDKL